MKEYTSRQPIVLPSMIKEAVEITNKRPSISSRTIPRTVHFVQQAIKLSGSEAAYIKSLDVRNAREAKLRIAEFAEATGKMLKAQRNNRAQRLVSYECDCTGKVSFKLLTGKEHVEHWTPTFTPHDEYCTGIKFKQKNQTITASEASPVLHDALRADPDLSEDSARTILTKYTSASLSKSFIQRAKAMAKEDLYGEKEDQAALVMAIKTAFEKKGHVVNVYEVGKEAQREIIREQFKKEHKKEHIERCKNLPEGEPHRKYKYEEPANLFEILDKYDDDTKFLYRYDIVFKHAKPIATLLKTVFSADAAHLRGDHPGTTFGTWGQDANNHILCFCFSVYFDNDIYSNSVFPPMIMSLGQLGTVI